MKDFTNKVAAITGAGSGIGRALALALAAEGARLALSDYDPVGLEETKQKIAAAHPNTQVHTTTVNVAERERVLDWAEEVVAHYGSVNLIFNNAGVAHHGTVLNTEFKDYERVIDIDFWGVVNGTKAFLPHLIASGDGHVVNISSLFGLIAVGGQSAYNAAKFAVRGFTESLRIELLASDNAKTVGVTCVHPGGIKTNVARSATHAGISEAKSEKLTASFEKYALIHTPDMAARTILTGVRRRRGRVLIGSEAKVLDLLPRLFGAGYQWAMVATARRTS